MNQHFKLHILILVLFFTGCKNKTNTETSSLKTTEAILVSKIIETKKINANNDNSWHFFSVYPIGSQKDDNIKTVENIYRELSFKIVNNTITINNLGKEELYINKIPSNKFFKQQYFKNYYQAIFKEKLNTPFPDSILAITNKNAHIKTSILKPLFNKAIIANNYFIIEQKASLILFKNKVLKQKEETTKTVATKQNNLFNKTLVGLTASENSYFIDDISQCMCNAPSFYIDSKTNTFYVYNYCSENNNPSNIENVYKYTIKNIEAIENQTQLILENQLNQKKLILAFNLIDKDLFIYKFSITGNFPKKFIGQRINKYFTLDKSNFKIADCKDFEG